MTLLGRVVRQLEALEVRFALIGAGAMAFHGASRATLDIDLLAVEGRALDSASWSDLRRDGIDVEIRPGDREDPLAGVVRFKALGERAVDLVVGKATWQRQVLDRAVPGFYASVELPVVGAADLVLLKLYAGGPQDAWDIRQLLAGDDGEALAEEIETQLGHLGDDERALWRRILDEG